MKRFTFITMLSLLVPLAGMSQNQNSSLDDVYFKPGDEAKIQKVQKAPANTPKATYKNGAKEIVYIDRESPKTKTQQNAPQLLAQANDSIVGSQAENESEYEYAQRIRQFHGSKDSTLRIDTVYQLTPVEINNYTVMNSDPYWWGYNRGYYGNWGWGWNNYWNSPFYGFGGYGSWGYNPWGYNYYGYGGYYGYGYPFYDYYGYYGYDNYYGYGGYYGYYGYGGYGGGGHNNKEIYRPASATNISRTGGISTPSQSVIGGSSVNSTSRNQYTVVSGSRTSNNGTSQLANTSSRQAYNSAGSSTSRNYQHPENGIGVVRSTGGRNISGLSQSYNSTGSTSRTVTSANVGGSSTINTRPRTSTTTYTTPAASSGGVTRGNYTSGSTVINRQTTTTYNNGGSSVSRGSYSTSTPTYSSGSRTATTSSSSSSYSSPSSSYSSPSYSSGSSSSSSSSYSSGSSSGSSGGSSRSSGGGGGRR